MVYWYIQSGLCSRTFWILQLYWLPYQFYVYVFLSPLYSHVFYLMFFMCPWWCHHIHFDIFVLLFSLPVNYFSSLHLFCLPISTFIISGFMHYLSNSSSSHATPPPTPPPAPLPHVPVTVGDACLLALLHPSNIFSVISEELVAQLQPLHGPFPRRPHASFCNYGQVRIHPVGTVLLNVTVFNRNVDLPVYIARDLPYPFMLGSDFMLESGMFMASDMKQILIDGVWLPVVFDTPPASPPDGDVALEDNTHSSSLQGKCDPSSSPSSSPMNNSPPHPPSPDPPLPPPTPDLSTPPSTHDPSSPPTLDPSSPAHALDNSAPLPACDPSPPPPPCDPSPPSLSPTPPIPILPLPLQIPTPNPVDVPGPPSSPSLSPSPSPISPSPHPLPPSPHPLHHIPCPTVPTISSDHTSVPILVSASSKFDLFDALSPHTPTQDAVPCHPASFINPCSTSEVVLPLDLSLLLVSVLLSCAFSSLSYVVPPACVLPFIVLSKLFGTLRPPFLTPPWPPDTLRRYTTVWSMDADLLALAC